MYDWQNYDFARENREPTWTQATNAAILIVCIFSAIAVFLAWLAGQFPITAGLIGTFLAGFFGGVAWKYHQTTKRLNSVKRSEDFPQWRSN